MSEKETEKNLNKISQKKQKVEEQTEEKDWRNKLNWERFYKIMLTGVSILVPFFLYDMSKFREYCDREGLRYQSSWMIPQAVCVALVLTVYRNVICRKLFYNFIYQNMNSKYKGDDRHVRTIKSVKWASDIIYYIAATIYSIIFFRHKKWFPLILNKDWYDQDQMLQWPNKIQDDVTFYIELYIVIQFGQHIYAFFELYFRRKTDPKFYEFTLHHIIALTNIFYSTQNNFLVPAVVQLVLHDVGDIFVAWFKLYGVFKTDAIFYLNTGNLIIVWFITRIYIFPKGVLLPSIEYFNQLYKVVGEEKEYQTHSRACYIYMLTLAFFLFGLHLYWFATMLTMLSKHLNQMIVTSRPVTFQNDHDFHTKKTKAQ